MSSIKIPERKKAKMQINPQAGIQEQALQLLRANAGAAHRRNLDPVYALSESYAQTFDFVGRQRVQETAGIRQADFTGTGMQDTVCNEESPYLRRFSEYAYRNGRLAAAILQGRGELVLNTCIRKSAGMSEGPVKDVQRRVDKSFDRRRIPQSGGAQVDFSGDVRSAINITLDASKTASQVLQSIYNAAALLDENEVASIKEIFPFLFDEEEHVLAQQLSRRKREMEEGGNVEGVQYRAVCVSLDKTRSVLNKKAQMKNRFLSELEQMLANAKAAEEIFQSDAYRQAAAEMLQTEYAEGAKPDENGTDGPADAAEQAGA